MKNVNGTVCMMGKFHNILYVAVKLCYDWQLKDTEIVATLLEHIYICEKTFERISVGAIFGTTAPHFIAGWKSDFRDQEENLRALLYFTDHATNAGLEFPCGNAETPTRFIDIPLESCGKTSALKITVQLSLPDKLHILLRFGAVLNPCYNDANNDNLVEYVLNHLKEYKRVYPYNIVACLQLLLRVVPRIVFGDDTKAVILEKYADLVEDGLIPSTRSGFVPPELKHLCRCVVRDRLWENFQLPNGIHGLPIPKTLMKYVDIMED